MRKSFSWDGKHGQAKDGITKVRLGCRCCSAQVRSAWCLAIERRIPQFTACVATLVPTEETKLIWQAAGGGALAVVRNSVVQGALDYFNGRPGWTLLVDDDHVFKNDMLRRLLRHDKDLMMPTVMMRKPPHLLVGFPPFDVPPDATDDELVDLARGDVQPLVIAPGTKRFSGNRLWRDWVSGRLDGGLRGHGRPVVRVWPIRSGRGRRGYVVLPQGAPPGVQGVHGSRHADRVPHDGQRLAERDEKGQITARIITGFDERKEVTTGG